MACTLDLGLLLDAVGLVFDEEALSEGVQL